MQKKHNMLYHVIIFVFIIFSIIIAFNIVFLVYLIF